MPVERYILWGWTARWVNVTSPRKITGASMRDCRRRERRFREDYPDALTAIHAPAVRPEALILQVKERLGTP